jgi:hypothetical protein
MVVAIATKLPIWTGQDPLDLPRSQSRSVWILEHGTRGSGRPAVLLGCICLLAVSSGICSLDAQIAAAPASGEDAMPSAGRIR